MHKYSLLEHFLFPPTYVNKQKLTSSLKGKTILITGASSGIGEQLAYALSEIQCHLILVARTKEKLLEVKNEVEKKEAKVTVYPADLRNKDEVEKLISSIEKLPQGLDLMVNNAGKSIRRSIFDSLDRYHDFTRTMSINYFAPVQLLLSLIPLLKKNNGQIINISTVNALLLPFPKWAAYQASKSAFDVWLRSVSPELNSVGISTTSIYLSLVKTPMIAPTIAYKSMPAMCPRHVARIISKVMYTKKRRHKPWWLFMGQIASYLLSPIWDLVASKNLS